MKQCFSSFLPSPRGTVGLTRCTLKSDAGDCRNLYLLAWTNKAGER